MLSKKITTILIGTSLLLCTSLVAAPAWKQVKAYLNPTVQYTLDGNSILNGTQTLSYNDKNYVSVSELANALGLEVSYKDNTVSFVTPNSSSATRITPATESITISKAVIKEISADGKQITILPDGKVDEVTSYIVLNVSSDTEVTHYLNKRIYKLSDLKAGMTVSVTHSPVMTRSMPPQTAAFTITILDEAAIAAPEDITLDNMVVVEVNHKENYFVVAAQGSDGTNPINQYIIRYDQTTKLNFDDNSKKQSNINALKVGMNVTLHVSPAMTLSIPPQTFVLEITVH